MFTLHDNNIPQIKATIKAYGKCYFHGDGNLYVEESDSDFRQKFSNPKSEGSQYRILFTDVKQVPSNTEDLQKKLMEARGKEIVESKLQTSNSPVKTVSVDEATEQSAGKQKSKQKKAEAGGTELTDDEKLAALIAEEEANQNK